MTIAFRILGPLQVTGPLGAISIPAARQRAILSALIFNAAKVVSADRLAEVAWGHSAPRTANTQIQICISKLRRALEGVGLPDRILTVSPGYRLVADENEIDLFVFERRVAAALKTIRQRPGARLLAQAVASARHALEVFPAEPLPGVDSHVLQGCVRQLFEHRLHILEECLDAQLSLGQAADVLDDTARLVAEHPLRGRLQCIHMRALQQLGRRAEAIAAYRETRRAYREQLGVEPDPELRRLLEDILRDLTSPGTAPVPTLRVDKPSRPPQEPWQTRTGNSRHLPRP